MTIALPFVFLLSCTIKNLSASVGLNQAAAGYGMVLGTHTSLADPLDRETFPEYLTRAPRIDLKILNGKTNSLR